MNDDTGDPYRVAVRELAAFALQRGDLERAPAGPDARAGQRAHQRLQERAQAASAGSVRSEVALRRSAVIDGATIVLAGRLDLVDTESATLIEIKSTLVPLERLLPGRRALDRAQLELYAWLAAGDDPAARIEPARVLELHYINLRSDEVQIDRWLPDIDAIAAAVQQALTLWLDLQRCLAGRQHSLERSGDNLAFPFGGFRPGQRSLSVAVWRSVTAGQPLLLEAPTGTGKTLGVLYPALRAVAAGHARRVCWLTAKGSGREAAFGALRSLTEQGLVVDAVQVRARRDACFCERDPLVRAADGSCPFNAGFHDRLPAARFAAFQDPTRSRLLDGEALDRLGEKHRICPHALASALVPLTTLVVCDYNHVFDPVAALPSLQEGASDRVLIVDEAHNLPERARQMRSASLSRTDCLDALAHCRIAAPSLVTPLERLTTALLKLPAGGVRATPETLADAPQRLLRSVGAVREALAEAQGANESASLADLLPRSLALALHRFQVVGELFGAEHRVMIETRQVGRRRDVIVRLVCLDASASTGRTLGSLRTSIAMSAVLRPMAAMRDALGLAAGTTHCLAAPSPFRAAHLHAQLIDWIPVGFSERERSLSKLVELIGVTVDAQPGHYLVFLPSHAYLATVADAFERARPSLSCWRQEQGAGVAGVALRLDCLTRPGRSVGFVITGGIFGEGVDFSGDRLIGAIVVGTALSGSDALTSLMIEAHRQAGRVGYDMVCRHPALARVLQSGGRVIRTAEDRGVLLLVDARFGDAFHTRWLPTHWRLTRSVDLDQTRALMAAFWSVQMTTPGSPAGKPGVVTTARRLSFKQTPVAHPGGAD